MEDGRPAHVLVVQLERVAMNAAGNKINIRGKRNKDPLVFTEPENSVGVEDCCGRMN